MKLVLKIAGGVLVSIVALYYLSFFVTPSITVVNNSGNLIELAKVKLPNSHLDFGSIMKGETNTLHYALTQQGGEYQYTIMLNDNNVISGRCGYVTHSEIHKRVFLYVTPNHKVICE